MPQRIPLPDGLPLAFTFARGRELGLGIGRLAGTDLASPFHGTRTTDSVPAGSSAFVRAIAACRAFAPLLAPHHVFTHTTAAMLWGAPLPRRFEGPLPLHVSSFTPHRSFDRRGVTGHRIGGDHVCVKHRFGLPTSDPAATFSALASLLALDDLVAVGDHLVLVPAVLDPRDMRPYISLESLHIAAASFSGRGCLRAEAAMKLVRAGAESVRETHLRLLLTRAGLPEPELNPDILSSTGMWLGRVDLAFRRWKVIVEYDGDQHRTDIRQYEKDIERVERFEADGWKHIRVRRGGLGAGGPSTVRRVTAALVARGWQPA